MAKFNVAQLQRSADFLSACPHPNKKVFGSMAAAEHRAEQIGGLMAYKCVCGKFHMTTDVDNPNPNCPICGTEIDEYTSCGCYEDIHYGP